MANYYHSGVYAVFWCFNELESQMLYTQLYTAGIFLNYNYMDHFCPHLNQQNDYCSGAGNNSDVGDDDTSVGGAGGACAGKRQ